MSDTNTEKQLHLTITDQNRRIALLEEKLQEKEMTVEALQDSEKRYRRLFESAKDGILILDADTGKVVDVNPFLLKLLGYSYDALYGQHIWELGVFKDIAASKDAFKTLQDNEYIRYENLPLETLDGRPIAVEFVSNVYLVDHCRVIQCNIRDITERKRAEEELKRTNNFLDSIIENIPNMIFIKDARELRFIRFNRAGEDLLGYSRNDLLGKNDYDLFPKEQADHFTEKDREVLSGKKVLDIPEETLQTLNRGERTIHTKKVPLLDSKGEPEFLLGISEDITEIKLSEAKLRQQAEAMDAAIDGIAILNEAGEYTYVNEAHVRLYGYENVGELIGKPWRILYDPDVLQRFEQEIMPEFGRKGDWHGETIGTKKNGSKFSQYISLTAIAKGGLICVVRDNTEHKRAETEIQTLARFPSENPNPVLRIARDGTLLYVNEAGLSQLPDWHLQEGRGVPSTVRNVVSQAMSSGKTRVLDLEHRGQVYSFFVAPIADVNYANIYGYNVTDHKRAESALGENKAKLRNIMDNIGIGVSLISPKMEVLELNHRMHEWFPAVDIGQRPLCYHAFHDPPREEVCDNCPTHRTLQDGLVHEDTMQMQRAGGGGVRNYRIISSPILDASGEVTAVIEIVEDITERLSLESQFRQAQKMEAVGRLAGGVAHDFNNMLGVIIGYTELAMDQVDSAQPLFAHLHEVRKAAGRSADLTRQLLAFARKQTVAPRVLDLNKTVDEMLKMLRSLIGEDINLTWLPGAGVWPVKVDPSQIDQIMANLCANARDAIAGIGKITIETHSVTFDETYCADHLGVVSGEFVLLAVSDDGCGMDKETLDNMFDPFFTTKEMGKGTGLGLATIYGIVKQNNGFINVYSEPGHGTTFKIYLPRHAGSIVEMKDTKGKADLLQDNSETVLLVEDEPAMLNVSKEILEKLGYTVLSAATPGDAMRLAEEYAGEIHLLMTDVVMPEMNGRDLAKRLKSLYTTLKCLFMSGYTSGVIAHHGVLDKGVHFIQKPFSKKDLAAKVRETLDTE